MSALVFGNDQEYLQWLDDNEYGWVINVLKSLSPSYMVLHHASCHTIFDEVPDGAFTERGYRKVCASSIAELSDWTNAHGRSNGDFSHECPKCITGEIAKLRKEQPHQPFTSGLEYQYATRRTDSRTEPFFLKLCNGMKRAEIIALRMAESIVMAHELDPECWAIEKGRSDLQMSVGGMVAITFNDQWVEFMIDVPTMRTVRNGKYQNQIYPTRNDEYDLAPSSRLWPIKMNDLKTLRDELDDAIEPHLVHIAHASQFPLEQEWRNWHHPGLVDVIGRIAGVSLPQPSYVAVAGRELHDDPNQTPSLSPKQRVTEYLEGKRRDVVQSRTERDPRARQACLDRFGTTCAACDSRLETIYGAVAEGLIHVHHLNPFVGGTGERVTRAETDLRPLCPNCHSVAHRRLPPYTIAELRAFIEVGSTAQRNLR